MRALWISLVLVLVSVSVSNTQLSVRPLNPQQHLFIITLDGFRWQEVFNGADPALVLDQKIMKDDGMSKALYWSDDPSKRRSLLLPFLWNVVSKRGQLHGNRDLGNKVNVANPYALSYPGYSELLTGGVDLSIFNNDKRENENSNVLESLSNSPAYKGRVAAFTSWDVFPYILDRQNSSFTINSGFESLPYDKRPSVSRLNRLQSDVAREGEETRQDELTYLACREYLAIKKPAVVFLSFSGTDNAGHKNSYADYLQQATNADRMIGELWRLTQTMPEYAGSTTFLITTDHGRGEDKSTWNKHGFMVPGSSQTWYALMGPSVVPSGEMKIKKQAYQKDLKDLMLSILSR